MEPTEVQELLAGLNRYLAEDLAGIWGAASSLASPDFRDVIVDAFPEVVLPYAAAASEVAAEWYDSTPTTNAGYRVIQSELPAAERLTASAQWALDVGTPETGLQLLQGSAERGVLDGARTTVLDNVNAELGASWARYASATACAFCRLMSIRGAVYRSKRAASFQSHDSCHCIAVPVRPGGSHTQPDYVSQWEKQYIQARRDAKSGDPKAILNAWDRALRA